MISKVLDGCLSLSAWLCWMERWLVQSQRIELTQNGWHFCRSCFQRHFLEWGYCTFYFNFTQICSHDSNLLKSSIGSSTDLVLNNATWHQATTWTIVYWDIQCHMNMVSQSHNGLTNGDLSQFVVIFLLLAPLWLSEMGQTWVFRVFPWECMERMALNVACWSILTTFRTD